MIGDGTYANPKEQGSRRNALNGLDHSILGNFV